MKRNYLRKETDMLAIKNAKIILENEIIDGATLLANDGVITSFGKDVEIPSGAEIIDACGNYLAPGFVDIHVHGGGGYDFCFEPINAAKYFLNHGETTVLATTYYHLEKEGLISTTKLIKQAMASGEADNIAGIYSEGPYMNPKYGASPEKNKWKGEITPDKYKELLEESKDVVKVWAVAPEREGIERFVKDAKEINPNVKFAMGHSEATPEQAFALKKYGLSIMVHCTNATGRIPPTSGGTRSCGPDEACFLDDDMYAELICDSQAIHVRPDMQKLIMKIKGIDKVILISDSFVSLEPTPDKFKHITDLSFDANGGLSGSKLTLDVSLKNVIKHTGCSIVDAIKMASTNPAKAVGLYDSVGSIEIGKKANLILLDDNYNLLEVFLSGKKVK